MTSSCVFLDSSVQDRRTLQVRNGACHLENPVVGTGRSKLHALSALFQAGHPLLALARMLGTAVSFYYYPRVLMRVLRTGIEGSEEGSAVPALTLGPSLVAALAALLTLGWEWAPSSSSALDLTGTDPCPVLVKMQLR